VLIWRLGTYSFCFFCTPPARDEFVGWIPNTIPGYYEQHAARRTRNPPGTWPLFAASEAVAPVGRREWARSPLGEEGGGGGGGGGGGVRTDATHFLTESFSFWSVPCLACLGEFMALLSADGPLPYGWDPLSQAVPMVDRRKPVTKSK
jgi:hypothetical protein